MVVKSEGVQSLWRSAMSKAAKPLIRFNRKKRTSFPKKVTLAEFRAEVKLPFKPAHITEEQIKRAVEAVAA